MERTIGRNSEKTTTKKEKEISAEQADKTGPDGFSMPSNIIAPDLSTIELFDKRENLCTLLLIRHGESLGNAVRSFLGHTDLDLSDRGYAQAKRTAQLLKATHIDKIYASDLKRAFNTGIEIGRLAGLAVETDTELREIYVGEWEGRSVSDLELYYPDEFSEWRDSFHTFVAPAGESVPHLRDRIFKRISQIASQNIGKTIVLAFHAAAIRAFWAKISAIGKELINEEIGFPYNASVSVAYFDGDKFIPGEYSHMKHLTDI